MEEETGKKEIFGGSAVSMMEPDNHDSSTKPIFSLKGKYEDFASSTSAHGFQYTIQENSLKSTLWSLVVILFVIVASYATSLTILDYINGPGFNSEYKLVYTVGEEGAQPLADFAICDIAPWDFKKAENMNISSDLISYLTFLIFPFEGNHQIFKDTALVEKMETSFKMTMKRFNYVTELLDSVTRSCEETFFFCRQGVNPEVSGKECCEKNFQPPTYTIEGKCWGTAGKMNYSQTASVKPLGMTLGLRMGKDISSRLNIKTGSLQATLRRGVSVILSGPKDHLFTAAAKKSSLIMPNTLNSVAVVKTVIDSSGLKECKRSDDLENIQAKSPGYRRYSKANCESNDLQNAAIKNLHCAIAMIPNPNNVRECSPLETIKFFQRAASGNPLGTGGLESCPLDCIQDDYNARISSQEVTQGFREIYKTIKNVTNIEEKIEIVVFQIYYPTFDFIQTVQHATGFSSLLGSIGGNLGLWIGASVFTILEFITAIISFLAGMFLLLYKRILK